MGRNQKPIDWEIVKKLCQIQCTRSEIASFFEISDATLVRRCQQDYACDFDTLFKQWSEHGKITLRRNQFRMAETNAALAIWLGKQYLGQSDKTEFNTEKAFNIKFGYDPEDKPQNSEEE